MISPFLARKNVAALEELALLKHVQGLRILMYRMDKYSRWI